MGRSFNETYKNAIYAVGIVGILALGVAGVFLSDFYEMDDDDGMVAEMQLTDAERMGLEGTPPMGGEALVQLGEMGPVTEADLTGIVRSGSMDPALFEGRTVDASGLVVSSVVGEQAFFVRPAGTDIEPILVHLGADPRTRTDAGGHEGVAEGDALALVGTIESLTEIDFDSMGLTVGGSASARGESMYVRATGIRMQ